MEQQKRARSWTWREKEFLHNGVPFEQIPIRETKIHYDDEILLELAKAVVMQALQDIKMLQRWGESVLYKNIGDTLYLDEVMKFFHSTFFGDLLLVIAPDVDQKAAVQSLLDYQVNPRRLGRKRGEKTKEKDGRALRYERR